MNEKVCVGVRVSGCFRLFSMVLVHRFLIHFDLSLSLTHTYAQVYLAAVGIYISDFWEEEAKSLADAHMSSRMI